MISDSLGTDNEIFGRRKAIKQKKQLHSNDAAFLLTVAYLTKLQLKRNGFFLETPITLHPP